MAVLKGQVLITDIGYVISRSWYKRNWKWLLGLLLISANASAISSGETGGLLPILMAPAGYLLVILGIIDWRKNRGPSRIDRSSHGASHSRIPTCPVCAKCVQIEAKICRFCNRDLSPVPSGTAADQIGKRNNPNPTSQHEQLQRYDHRWTFQLMPIAVGFVVLTLVVTTTGLLLARDQPNGTSYSDHAVATATTQNTFITTTTVGEETTISLEPVTIELRDGRYLKFRMALQLRSDSKGQIAESGETTLPEVLDIAIEILGARSYEELRTPTGRNDAKKLLLERLTKETHQELEAIYFTEFVMQ